MVNRHNSHTTSKIALAIYIVGVLAVGGLLLAIGLSGVGSAAEVGNESVDVTNTTGELVVDVEFSGTAADENVTVDVTVENSSGAVVKQTAIDGVNNSWAVERINASDLDAGSTYTVRGDATDDTGADASSYVATFDVTTSEESDSGGGGGTGSTSSLDTRTKQGIVGGICVLLVVTGVIKRRGL